MKIVTFTLTDQKRTFRTIKHKWDDNIKASFEENHAGWIRL